MSSGYSFGTWDGIWTQTFHHRPPRPQSKLLQASEGLLPFLGACRSLLFGRFTFEFQLQN